MLSSLTEVTWPVSGPVIQVCVQSLPPAEKGKAPVSGSLLTPISCSPSPPLGRSILFYSMGYKSLLSVFILILTLTQIWLVGAPSGWFLYFLICFYNFLSTSLLSVTRYSRSFLSQPWSQLFLQGNLVRYVIIRHNI